MPRSVLLVDDNLAVQKLVELTLRKEGFEISSVDNALSAIDLALKQPPDLILADFNLEGMNVFSFVQKIRQKEKLKEVAVVLLINSTENYDPTQLQSAGIQAFLKKPVDSKELVEEVKKQTGTSETVMIDLKALPKKQEEHSLSEHFSNSGGDAVKIEELLGWSSPGSLAQNPLEQLKTEKTMVASMPSLPNEPHNGAPEEEEEPLEKTQFLQASPRVGNGAAEKSIPLPDRPVAPVEESPSMEQMEERVHAAADEERSPIPPQVEAVQAAAPASPGVPHPPEIEAGIKKSIQDAVEKVVWEVLPGVIESALSKEAVKGIVEEVVWEVVPSLAEIEIKKEIKRLEPEENSPAI